eukprot:2538728-Amphidinium_carterae.1
MQNVSFESLLVSTNGSGIHTHLWGQWNHKSCADPAVPPQASNPAAQPQDVRPLQGHPASEQRAF